MFLEKKTPNGSREKNSVSLATFLSPSVLTVLTGFFLAQGVTDAALVSVNLGPSGLPAESGFTAWTAGDSSTPSSTTVNGIGLSLAGSLNDSGTPNNIVRSINRGGDDGYGGALSSLTQTWWGVRRAGTSSGGFLTLAIDGSDLGAGTFQWTSWHHDHQDQTGQMDIEVSVDGGSTWNFGADDFDIVDGNSGQIGAPNPATFSFTSNGTDDVQVRFTNVNASNNSNSFALVNGFEIASQQVIPEVSSAVLGFLSGVVLLLRRRRN